MGYHINSDLQDNTLLESPWVHPGVFQWVRESMVGCVMQALLKVETFFKMWTFPFTTALATSLNNKLFQMISIFCTSFLVRCMLLSHSVSDQWIAMQIWIHVKFPISLRSLFNNPGKPLIQKALMLKWKANIYSTFKTIKYTDISTLKFLVKTGLK